MNKKFTLVTLAAALMLSSCGNTIADNSDIRSTVSSDATSGTQTAPPPTESPADVVTTTSETVAVTTTTPTTTTLPVTTTEPPAESSYEFMNGCILAYSGTPQVRAMEEFYYSPENGRYLADCIDVFAESVGANVNTSLMLIPTSQEFYTPDELKDSYPDQKECADEVYGMMTSGIGVPINSVLEEHKAEYIYSRTDYHWQPLAAYYAAKVYAEQSGVDFADFESYEEVEREGYLGAFYSVNDIYPLEEYPDTFTYYKPADLDKLGVVFHDTYFSDGYEGQLFFEDNDLSSSYTVFVGTDDTILEIDTDAPNDRVLVIFKDSYGNALVPFLTSSFKKIYLCDNRFFDINSVSFAHDVGATDVLFALGAASSSSYDKIELIENNMYK